MALLAKRAANSLPFQVLTLQFGDWSFIDPWIRHHFVYVHDPEDVELVRTPEMQLQQIWDRGVFFGDCDDVATFEATVFTAYGIHSRFCAIRQMTSDIEFSHVFVEALIDNQWQTFDPTCKPRTQIESVEKMLYVV